MSGPPPLPSFFSAVWLDVIDSTNDELKRRADAGASEGLLLCAETQSAGHGRHGRPWVSPRGNLYCSLLLRPKAPAAKTVQFSYIAALAAAEAVERQLPPGFEPVTCKWPNDILLKGRKIGGILLESGARASRDGRLDWLVIGVGINVLQYPSECDFPATALAEWGGRTDRAKLLADFAAAFDRWRGLWDKEGFAPVRQAWLKRAQWLGQKIEVRTSGGQVIGVFAGVDDAGALIVQGLRGERHIVAAGDVFRAAAGA
jgi:BirA family biotin operon repressor/biotin-[acetyl-CoA-carboxylase] ligase